jgi:hypothetical protein
MGDIKIKKIIIDRLKEQKIDQHSIIINDITVMKPHNLDIKFTHEDNHINEQFKIFNITCTESDLGITTITTISIIAGDSEDVAISTINNLPFKCWFICGINEKMMTEIKLINGKYYAIIPKEESVNYSVELDLIKIDK